MRTTPARCSGGSGLRNCDIDSSQRSKLKPTTDVDPCAGRILGAGPSTAGVLGRVELTVARTGPRFEERIPTASRLWRAGDVHYRETENLRVLIANERKDRLALVAPIVTGLGHEVIAREIDVADVGEVTARERPDVALVGLGESSDHALGLIEKIVHESACPVIVLLHAPDPAFVKEASKRGVFAYITDRDADEWQSSIDIVLRRFAEYHDLEGAFGRRAVTERAKGILMERHSVDDERAFAMLREHARTTNRKLVDVASAVVDGHRLLPKSPSAVP
jgi:AmiR/NasT family two-component response regulator